MRDIIYNILFKTYHNHGGAALCDWLTERLADKIANGTTWDDVRMTIWMATTGGGVSIAAANEIMAAFPGFIEDTRTGTEL